MFRVIYDSSKNLKKDREILFKDTAYSTKIRQVLEEFGKNPFGGAYSIKKLEPKSNEVFRLRIGDYRVIFSVDFGNRIIIVHRIQHRKDAYK